MRESKFIKQKSEQWQEFEDMLGPVQERSDPEQLNRLFVQITDDLSHSRTFYPNRMVRVYLNGLAQRIFFKLFKYRKTRRGRFLFFWTDELPLLMYDARKAFRTSFLLFALAFCIGAFSSAMDPDFPRYILGDSYVNMTESNIESGDPMAVYKDKGAFNMFMGITLNNLVVAFLTFILGLLFSLGTIAILVSNGIMIGAFQYFFYDKGLLQESFLTIWMHGTLEISSIIIAGAAGITLGSGLVFPGTLSRLQAFQLSARRALKIMVGIVPVFILAGFIEGFFTRFTEAPDLLRLFFILLSLGFVLFYFVWWPRKKAREHPGFSRPQQPLRLKETATFDQGAIYSSGELLTYSFSYYRQHLHYFLRTSLLGALFFLLAFLFLGKELPSEVFTFSSYFGDAFEQAAQLLFSAAIPFQPAVQITIFSLIGLISLFRIQSTDPKDRWAFSRRHFLKVLVIMALFYGLLYTNSWYTLALLLPLAAPILFIGLVLSIEQNKDLIQAAAATIEICANRFGRVWGLYLLIWSISLLSFLLLDTGILWFYLDFIGWNLQLSGDQMSNVFAALIAFTLAFLLYALLPLALIGARLQYFSLQEIATAAGLMEEVDKIGSVKKIQGLEKE